MTEDRTKSIKALKRAFAGQRLTLFVGAGASVANGLPSWEKLVLSIYFATISEQQMNGWRPFSNYLYAISEWYLRETREPLEIVSRKVRSFYKKTPEGEAKFMQAVRDAIYGVDTFMSADRLLRANSTLKAIVDLTTAKARKGYGVRSVITYNYDSLLEMALADRRTVKPVFSKNCFLAGEMPIFHVHGYVPLNTNSDIELSDIVFTEESYNESASNPYSWSNVVQLREMSSNVGLMVGLSVSDRNIRRLLDALSNTPVKPEIYALFRRPVGIEVSDKAAASIHSRAIAIMDQFRRSGIKAENERISSDSEVGYRRRIGTKDEDRRPAQQKGETEYESDIRGIIREVEALDLKRQDSILRQLGITPIWYVDHKEIRTILGDISGE